MPTRKNMRFKLTQPKVTQHLHTPNPTHRTRLHPQLGGVVRLKHSKRRYHPPRVRDDQQPHSYLRPSLDAPVRRRPRIDYGSIRACRYRLCNLSDRLGTSRRRARPMRQYPRNLFLFLNVLFSLSSSRATISKFVIDIFGLVPGPYSSVRNFNPVIAPTLLLLHALLQIRSRFVKPSHHVSSVRTLSKLNPLSTQSLTDQRMSRGAVSPSPQARRTPPDTCRRRTGTSAERPQHSTWSRDGRRFFALVIGRGAGQKWGSGGGAWGFPSAGLAVRLESWFGPVGKPRI